MESYAVELITSLFLGMKCHQMLKIVIFSNFLKLSIDWYMMHTELCFSKPKFLLINCVNSMHISADS